MFIMIIGIFVSFLQIFTSGRIGFLYAAVAIAIDVYLLICIYSLYDTFIIGDNVSNVHPQEQQPVAFQYSNVLVQQPPPYNQQPADFNQTEISLDRKQWKLFS